MVEKFKLKKGDEVIVLTGKDKGKTGKILKMLPKQMKAIVSEINRVKKKPSVEGFFLPKNIKYLRQIYIKNFRDFVFKIYAKL